MLQHGSGAHCCSNLAVELSAPVHGDADVGQHTIVELLEFANVNVNAPLSGQATRQLDASQDEAAARPNCATVVSVPSHGRGV